MRLELIHIVKYTATNNNNNIVAVFDDQYKLIDWASEQPKEQAANTIVESRVKNFLGGKFVQRSLRDFIRKAGNEWSGICPICFSTRLDDTADSYLKCSDCNYRINWN